MEVLREIWITWWKFEERDFGAGSEGFGEGG